MGEARRCATERAVSSIVIGPDSITKELQHRQQLRFTYDPKEAVVRCQKCDATARIEDKVAEATTKELRAFQQEHFKCWPEKAGYFSPVMFNHDPTNSTIRCQRCRKRKTVSTELELVDFQQLHYKKCWGG